MKAIFLFIFLLVQFNLFAEVPELTSAEILSQIVKSYSNGNFIETTLMSNKVISGRCFTEYSKQPRGAALVVEQRLVDAGPLGNANDLITYGQILSDDDTGKFDSLNYDYFKFLISKGQIQDRFKEIYIGKTSIYLDGLLLRIGQDGNIYGVEQTSTDKDGNPIYGHGCYFFKDNN